MVQKTIQHYLADLCSDLKITLETEMTTAQLTRCVERAVADYSRFVPRQMSQEITVDAEVTGESFTTPAVANANYFVNAVTLVGEVSGGTMSLSAQRPDVPRPVKLTVVDANSSINVLVVIVKGYDADNAYIEENFYLEAGLVQTGQVYFAYITQVELDQINGNGAGDTLSLGTASADGVYVQLSNKPIKLASEAITGYTLDTDYEMDYAGGRIAMKSDGSMAVSTAYTIAYTKSRIDIDLSTVIDDYIRVERVEYPVGQIPQQFSKMELWGDILTLTGSYDTQAEISDTEHLVVKYLTCHSSPNTQSAGSYPSFMDTTVQLAASAYALFIRALQYEQQSVTDLASSRTALGSLAAIHTLIATALAKVTTYTADMNIALDAAISELALGSAEIVKGEAIHTLAKAALVLTDTQLDAAVVAGLFTKVDTALDAIATKIGLVDTYLTAAADPSAKKYLTDGDAYIDAINDGKDVAENFASYSQRSSELATTLLAEATAYVNEASVRLTESDRWREAGRAWSEQASVYLAEVSQYIASAGQYANNAMAYVEEANGRRSMCQAFTDEANARLVEQQSYLAESQQYQAAAESSKTLAEQYRYEAIERRNEAWAIWASPNQIAPNYSLGQRSQPS